MTISTQISFHDIDPSPAVEQNIRSHVEKLAEFDDRIHWCKVTVETEGRHQHKGRIYRILIHLGLPGKTLNVNRAGPHQPAHADIYVAIRDAFKAAQRQIADYARVRRDDIKTHAVPEHGKIVKLVPEENYGLIETAAGEEVYFHRNALVTGDFDQLENNTEVRLEIAYNESEERPQATTVKLVGKHHIVS